jgi:uncharacterized membrane protein
MKHQVLRVKGGKNYRVTLRLHIYPIISFLDGLLVLVDILVSVVLCLEVLLISVALHLSEDLLLSEGFELLLVVTMVMGATMEITTSRFS